MGLLEVGALRGRVMSNLKNEEKRMRKMSHAEEYGSYCSV